MNYRPNPKVVAGAIATLLAWGFQAVAGIDVPPGIEGAFAVVVAYLVPGTGVEQDVLVPDDPSA